MKASHRIVGIVGALVATAVLIVFTLEYDWMGTLIADDMAPIDTVYKALTIASIPFFIIICAILAFCLVEFRAKPDDDEEKDGAPFHGSTKIEIVWTIIPTIVVMALGLYAWAVLDKVEAKQPNSMTIKVIGQQFAWNYQYPEYDVKTRRRPGRARQPPALLRDDIRRRHPQLLRALGPRQARCRRRIHHTHPLRAEQARLLPDRLHRALRNRPRDDAFDAARSHPGRVHGMGRGAEVRHSTQADRREHRTPDLARSLRKLRVKQVDRER